MIDQKTIALVTGANRGLGAQFVETLLARGAGKVYAASRSPQDGRAAHGDKRVVPLMLDVTDARQVHEASLLAPDVTLLINNAGLNRQSTVLADTQPDAARAEMEVNYFGTLALVRAFAPQLIASHGAIVNVLSILARVTLPGMASLCASKAAALRLTEAFDAELGPRGVRVLGVMPGAIDTEMSRDFPGEKLSTSEVVDASLDALSGTAREVYVGQMARELAIALGSSRASIHASLLGVGQA